MKHNAIASGSGIKDFNEGPNTMSIFDQVVGPLEQRFIDTLNGYSNNLRSILYSIFDFKQKEGHKAAVTVVFTKATASLTESKI